MNIYYVYFYLRQDFTPYYVGKGKNNRAWSKSKGEIIKPKDRSKILLVEQNLTELQAFVLERYYIRWFGRKDLGTGILRNKTSGGEGGDHPNKKSWKGTNNPFYGTSRTGNLNPFYNKKHNEESRKKIKEARAKQVFTKESNKKGGDARKGSKNPRALLIYIFDNLGNLKFVSNGNFVEICKKEKLPQIELKNSYRNKGIPIYQNKRAYKKYAKYIGWYAKIIPSSSDQTLSAL